MLLIDKEEIEHHIGLRESYLCNDNITVFTPTVIYVVRSLIIINLYDIMHWILLQFDRSSRCSNLQQRDQITVAYHLLIYSFVFIICTVLSSPEIYFCSPESQIFGANFCARRAAIYPFPCATLLPTFDEDSQTNVQMITFVHRDEDDECFC